MPSTTSEPTESPDNYPNIGRNPRGTRAHEAKDGVIDYAVILLFDVVQSGVNTARVFVVGVRDVAAEG